MPTADEDGSNAACDATGPTLLAEPAGAARVLAGASFVTGLGVVYVGITTVTRWVLQGA